jgi:hypothetical protein
MANLEKHSRNVLVDWLQGEETGSPAQPRSRRIVGSSSKPATKKFRPVLKAVPEPKPDPALAREPVLPHKVAALPQHSAPEHLRRLEKLPKLRAPYAQRGVR